MKIIGAVAFFLTLTSHAIDGVAVPPTGAHMSTPYLIMGGGTAHFMGGAGYSAGQLASRFLVSVDGATQKRLLPGFENPFTLEFQTGASFVYPETHYPMHLQFRWHFVQKQTWSLYTFGGLGLTIRPHEPVFFGPRAGWGYMYSPLEFLSIRAEISPDFFGAGISITPLAM